MIWHSSEAKDILNELGVDPKVGLSSTEVLARIKKYGENKVSLKGSKTLSKEFLKRFLTPVNIALIFLSMVLMVTDAIVHKSLWISPIIIPLILAGNALLGGFLVIKNEKSTNELKDRVHVFAKVLRGGEVQRVDSAQLVPGDIVFLEQGDFIPADGRILEETSLICDEFAVTGDSAPMEKNVDVKFEDMCPLNERSNMLYLGCSVTFGRAVMVVTDTGNFTELGKINKIKEQTVGTEIPVKKYLKELSKTVEIALIISAAVLFIIGVIAVKDGSGFSDLVLNMLTLVLSLYSISISRSFTGLVDAAISFCIKGMSKRNAILKNPEKLETIGRVSVIISDKTGTLTRNNMKMTSFFDGNRLIDLKTEDPDEKAVTIIRTGALCCDGEVLLLSGGREKEVGDPTEVGISRALLNYCGLTKAELENIYPRMAEVPFDSNRKLKTTVNIINNKPFAVVKGTPEMLFKKVIAGNLEAALKAAVTMGQAGERVIAVAIKPLSEVPSNPTAEELECNLTLLGLFGMSDSISRSTRGSLEESRKAGIRTIMVTGDHITTATTMAKDLGILEENQIAVTGKELGGMSDEELCSKVRDISVYCQINDLDKVRIVKAWQSVGETVLVTGDSIDDAEAMKIADASAAMGTGKDITKQNADLLITDDSYIAILNAVKTARNTFLNIRHGVQFYFAVLIAEVLSLFFGFIIFGKSPFTAGGLLIINTILLLVLSRVLAGEPDRKISMPLPPRGKREGIFHTLSDFDFAWQGALVALLTLISFGANLRHSATGAAFLSAGICILFLVFAIRICSSIYREGFKVSKNLIISLAVALLAVVVLAATPISYLFGLNGIVVGNVFASLLFGVITFAVIEAVKMLREYLKSR